MCNALARSVAVEVLEEEEDEDDEDEDVGDSLGSVDAAGDFSAPPPPSMFTHNESQFQYSNPNANGRVNNLQEAKCQQASKERSVCGHHSVFFYYL